MTSQIEKSNELINNEESIHKTIPVYICINDNKIRFNESKKVDNLSSLTILPTEEHIKLNTVQFQLESKDLCLGFYQTNISQISTSKNSTFLIFAINRCFTDYTTAIATLVEIKMKDNDIIKRCLISSYSLISMSDGETIEDIKDMRIMIPLTNNIQKFIKELDFLISIPQFTGKVDFYQKIKNSYNFVYTSINFDSLYNRTVFLETLLKLNGLSLIVDEKNGLIKKPGLEILLLDLPETEKEKNQTKKMKHEIGFKTTDNKAEKQENDIDQVIEKIDIIENEDSSSTVFNKIKL